MKALITTGHSTSGITSIWPLIRAYGVAPAAPAQSETNAPDVFHQKLYVARKVAEADAAGQIEPGRMWRNQAENLLIHNVDSPLWGWADTRSSRLLDFWAEVDQSTHFILLYVAPEVAYAMATGPHLDATDASVDVLASWRQKNSELLNFYSRNRDRCLLINTYSLLARPDQLGELLNDRFGMTSSTEAATSLPDIAYWVSALSTLMARSRLQDAEAAMLFEELETASDLPTPSNHAAQELTRAWTEHVRLAGKESELKLTLTTLQATQKTLAERNIELEKARSEIQAGATRKATEDQEKAKLGKQFNELNGELEKLRLTNKEQGSENELLLLQLHQVQEELESYFLRVQDMEAKLKQSTQGLEAGQQELLALQTRMRGLEKDRQTSEQDKISMAKRITELEAVLIKIRHDAESKAVQAASEQNALVNQVQQINAELDGAKKKLAELQQRASEANQARQNTGQESTELRARIAALEADLCKARKSAQEQSQENELLLLQLHQVQEELETYFLKYQELQAAKPESAPVLASTQFKAVDNGNAKPTRKFGLMQTYLEKHKSARKLKRQVMLIQRSGLFDAQWYLNEYTDVAKSGIDPIKHYLKFGAEEGRDPSLKFDTRYYQRTNPDLQNSGLNPLIHYISHGKEEGRKPHP
jgi:myosin heavy subunit